MKARTTVTTPTTSSSLDSLLLILAGALVEMQTRGDVKPFGLQRRTLRALQLRAARH